MLLGYSKLGSVGNWILSITVTVARILEAVTLSGADDVGCRVPTLTMVLGCTTDPSNNVLINGCMTLAN